MVCSIAKIVGYPLGRKFFSFSRFMLIIQGGLLADKKGIRVTLMISFFFGILTLFILSLPSLYSMSIFVLAFFRGK
jgi:nitrate/nitrite transporter NarK